MEKEEDKIIQIVITGNVIVGLSQSGRLYKVPLDFQKMEWTLVGKSPDLPEK